MDINTLAKSIVDQATGEKPVRKPDPRASARGMARAAVLTPEKRTSIAKAAAQVRWKKS